ncbi:hypothetical protein DENSPDRAFT_846486 [Dentipellis sp. KUC8613]|nr:hypothetical protein DENSPDRAFT_846486 [Dentipellis sp. KUC8613]
MFLRPPRKSDPQGSAWCMHRSDAITRSLTRLSASRHAHVFSTAHMFSSTRVLRHCVCAYTAATSTCLVCL